MLLWERCHVVNNIDLQFYMDIAKARSSNDPAHDFLHVTRVAANARTILEYVDADDEIVLVAAYLHELFNYPKGHPRSKESGDVCAEHALAVMEDLDFPKEKRDGVTYAIANHSFSKGVVPVTCEGKILQDADRLDAIGAIGIARLFSTCASMERPFYHVQDPFCKNRVPDDKEYGLDHVFVKLLRIPDTLHTDVARQLAVRRIEWIQSFLEQLDGELG